MMKETARSTDDFSECGLYEIRITGHLNERWTTRFEGLTITLEENGDTCLTGPVADQAALHGLLKTVRDAGMPLLAVNRIESDRADESNEDDHGKNHLNQEETK